MATREKTVSFSFPMFTTLMADATVTNLTQITLYIPEASPTFTSVFVELGFQDVISATGGTIGEHRCGLRLDAAGYTTVTELDDLTHSGENIAGVVGPFDFTSHFTTNWTGTSMTCDLQAYFDQTTGTTLGMRNVTAVIYITYTYDDTAATQLKTVRIPLESRVDSLPTTATNFGTSQIPQLTGSGGMLPEAGVTIRDYYFLIEGNESNNGQSSDFTISANIDGSGSVSFGQQESALASDRFCRWIYKPAVPTTTTTHNIQLSTGIANKASHLTVTLVITYQFTLSGTTRVLNSISLPIEMSSPLGTTTTAEANRFERSISIQEPGTITLKQSAFRMNWNTNGNATSIRWRAGSQAYRNYTPFASVVCGMFSVQQRIDSGGAQGAGITLARGSNAFVLDGYATSATVKITNINGVLILNYESDLAPEGIGAHNHTIMKSLISWDAALTDLSRIDNYAFAIPETNYFLTSVGFLFTQWVTSASMAITFDVECLTGEAKGGGYYDIYGDAYSGDSELTCSMIWMRGRDVFLRFPGDAASDRVDIETARDYRLYTTTTCGNGIVMVVTYHSLIWTVAGTLTGNDPAKTTLVELIRANTGEVRKRTTLAAGVAAFSFTTFDNTEDYYVNAYQDATHLGRSTAGHAA